MNKPLRLFLVAAFLAVIIAVLLTGCNNQASDSTLQTNPPPETTVEIIPEGVFYLRCSEPEANQFSVQFVGAVPTSFVDYVGFEANKLYDDGTRGAVTAVKIYTLHKEITDADTGTVITPEDFGMKDGYLFARSLEKIPTDEEGLSYEIAAFYMIGSEKYYTAKQTFSVEELLNEHILANPEPFPAFDESPLIDVQKWVKCTSDPIEEDKNYENPDADKLSTTYFMGASAPDNNGNVKMYICYAVPSLENSNVGIRYNLTETEGDNEGISTQVRRARINTLYRSVITEKETLTIESFGLTEGYLAVVCLESDLNTVLRETYTLNLLAYYSVKALEYTVIYAETSFEELCEACIVTRASASIEPYTFVPANYTNWSWLSEENGNVTGNGLFALRVSYPTNVDGDMMFDLQIATGVPTRFSERIAFVYTAYDKDGNVVGKEIREISVTALYAEIFGDDDQNITSKNFGIDRGYIMSVRLTNIELEGEVTFFKMEAYYRNTENEKVVLASQIIPLETMADMIENS